MTQIKKLVELINEADSNYNFKLSVGKIPKPRVEYEAEFLLKNGVIVPPCKVGTKVWILRKDRVPDDDYRMSFHNEWVICEVNFQLSMIDQIGKTVFLTPEEAKKALESYKENT